MTLSSCVVDLGPRASPRKRGKYHFTSPFGFFRSDEISGTRVLHLAEIVAPKLKTSATDEEVCSH